MLFFDNHKIKRTVVLFQWLFRPEHFPVHSYFIYKNFFTLTDSLLPKDVAKKSTTLKPDTTTKPTEQPTTSSTTTTSTTTTPPSTTTAAPDTTTTVKPNPGPEVGNWTWTDNNTNNTCVIIQMAARLNVTYLDKSNIYFR